MIANKEEKAGKESWEEYREREMLAVTPLIAKLGFTQEEEQVHISGERYLMSGKKLVLIGREKESGKRVVIKVSGHTDGKKEIEHDRMTRVILGKLNFAYRDFFSPEEILFEKHGEHTILITSFIEQEKAFITLPLEEQFFLALRAFETQEGVHMTTLSHTQSIQKIFNVFKPTHYISSFEQFRENAISRDPQNKKLSDAFNRSCNFLEENLNTIERYCGFLTHTDFVPHNFRVSGKDIYLLDHTEIHFGNKYESWARFVNFMIHHNPALEQKLIEYVEINRGKDEYLSLRLMRIYKIGFLLQYYTETLEKTSDKLHELMRLRVGFWSNMLNVILEDSRLSKKELLDFTDKEDALRSDEEKKRQAVISARVQINV